MRHIHALATLILLCQPLRAEIQDAKLVFSHHAPAAFYATLNKVDVEQRIITAQREWFSPAKAKFWAIFIETDRDLNTLPPFIRQVAEVVSTSEEPLVRANAKLSGERELTVQINDLSKTPYSADFQGCIAALDMISVAYANPDFGNSNSVDDHCEEYR